MKINLVVEDVELKDLPLTVTVANPDLAKYVMREFEIELEHEKAENWEASYLAQVAYRATLEGQIRDLKAEVLKYKNSARFLK